MTRAPDRDPAAVARGHDGLHPDPSAGVACVGDLGSALRRSHTAVGDGVNLAARIEGTTRTCDVPLLVVDNTRAAACELAGCEWVEVGEVAVKGRSERVTLYLPLSVRAPGCRIPPRIPRRNSRPSMNNLAFGALHAMRCAGTMAKARGRSPRRPRALSLARD